MDSVLLVCVEVSGMVGLGKDTKRAFKERRRYSSKRRRGAFIVVLALCAVIVGAAAYYVYQPKSGSYHYVMQYRWNVPPTSVTTDAFTIGGEQWYVQWSYVGNRLWDSLDISVRDANTNALVQEVVNSTGQFKHYFDMNGTFVLSLTLNNPQNIEPSDQITISVDVSELR